MLLGRFENLTAGHTSLQAILQAPLLYHPPTRPGGDFASLHPWGTSGTAIPNTGAPGRCGTLQHTTLVKSPEYTRTFCAVRKSLVSLSLCLQERASRGLIVPLAVLLNKPSTLSVAIDSLRPALSPPSGFTLAG